MPRAGSGQRPTRRPNASRWIIHFRAAAGTASGAAGNHSARDQDLAAWQQGGRVVVACHRRSRNQGGILRGGIVDFRRAQSRSHGGAVNQHLPVAQQRGGGSVPGPGHVAAG